MHTRPRPTLVMKLMASGVAFSAAITRSPSSSRLRSSTTITMRPAWISSSAASIVSNGAGIGAPPCGIKMRSRKPRDVLGHDVHLDVDLVAGALARDRRRGKCVGNQRHREAFVHHSGDGQADAINSDALADGELWRHLGTTDREAAKIRRAFHCEHISHTLDDTREHLL